MRRFLYRITVLTLVLWATGAVSLLGYDLWWPGRLQLRYAAGGLILAVIAIAVVLLMVLSALRPPEETLLDNSDNYREARPMIRPRSGRQ